MHSVDTSQDTRAGKTAADSELEEAREDREWLDKLRNAKAVPYLSSEESLAFLRRIANDGAAKDKNTARKGKGSGNVVG